MHEAPRWVRVRRWRYWVFLGLVLALAAGVLFLDGWLVDATARFRGMVPHGAHDVVWPGVAPEVRFVEIAVRAVLGGLFTLTAVSIGVLAWEILRTSRQELEREREAEVVAFNMAGMLHDDVYNVVHEVQRELSWAQVDARMDYTLVQNPNRGEGPPELDVVMRHQLEALLRQTSTRVERLAASTRVARRTTRALPSALQRKTHDLVDVLLGVLETLPGVAQAMVDNYGLWLADEIRIRLRVQPDRYAPIGAAVGGGGSTRPDRAAVAVSEAVVSRTLRQPLSNAIAAAQHVGRAEDQNTDIYVAVFITDDVAWVSVRDYGEGLPRPYASMLARRNSFGLYLCELVTRLRLAFVLVSGAVERGTLVRVMFLGARQSDDDGEWHDDDDSIRAG